MRRHSSHISFHSSDVSPRQNVSVPSLDQLCQVVSEREQQSSIKLNRVSAAPVIESTSVAPRQRPKASQLATPGAQLALGLPLQNQGELWGFVDCKNMIHICPLI